MWLRSKFYNENFILIKKIDGEKVEAEDQLITSSFINTLPEPLSKLPMQNHQNPFFVLPSTSSQTQNVNANAVPTFATFFLLGILLLWLYKKLFDSESKINNYQANSIMKSRSTFFSSQINDETINDETIGKDNILHRNNVIN